METLTSLALYGLPIGGVIVLGVMALRSVFQNVSLSDTTPQASNAEKRAAGLGLQLAIAEDLGGVDPVTLNALKDQVDLATADAQRARQTEAERQTVPGTIPWFAPVTAAHNIVPKTRPDSQDEN